MTATAPGVSDLFAFRLNNSANSDNRATGDILIWGANLVNPASSSYGRTLQCATGQSCTSLSDPDWTQQALFRRNWTLRPDQFFASRPYSELLTKPWILAVSSKPDFSSDNTIVNTPAVGSAGIMKFVESMTASGTGVTPTVSWTLPSNNLPVDPVRFRIYDRSNPITVVSSDPLNPIPSQRRSFQQSDFIFEQVLPGNATSFALPQSWSLPNGNPKSLAYNQNYSIDISLEHNRLDGTLESRSSSTFEFTPLNLPGIPNIYLPSVTPVATTSGLISGGNPYSFRGVPASPGEVTFIDPLVATGFSYFTDAGDPNFKSVVIPAAYGDGLFEVMVWDGSNWITTKTALQTNETFDFTANGYSSGVDRFRITGIEVSAGVSPTNLTGFVTGLTFVANGTFNGTMQAMVVDVAAVPEPNSSAMLMSGLLLIGWRLTRLRCRSTAKS